jgi:hypothetical protein
MRRYIDFVASELRTELFDDFEIARIVAAIGTEQHMQVADALGSSQVIEAVPEKFRPAPARNDQDIAVLYLRIWHGASVSRIPMRRCRAHRTGRAGHRLLDRRIRHCAWS